MGRLDNELVSRGYYTSRARAKLAIDSLQVSVNGNIAKKASQNIDSADIIKILDDPLPYVGRGALKLKAALEYYSAPLANAVCADIGASTGGFTQVMLEHGAAKVYAVDVGHGQLADELKADSRVVNMEGTDARNLGKEYNEYFDFIAVDVSFISLKLILPEVHRTLKKSSYAICLIKPQFEAGRQALNKKGIVTSEKIRAQVIASICEQAQILGFELIKDIIPSPLQGGKYAQQNSKPTTSTSSEGNTEYLICLKKS